MIYSDLIAFVSGMLPPEKIGTREQCMEVRHRIRCLTAHLLRLSHFPHTFTENDLFPHSFAVLLLISFLLFYRLSQMFGRLFNSCRIPLDEVDEMITYHGQPSGAGLLWDYIANFVFKVHIFHITYSVRTRNMISPLLATDKLP